MSHPTIFEQMINDRRNNLLEEAESHRKARQAKKKPYIQANQLMRKVRRFGRRLINPVSQLADQGKIPAKDAFTDAYS